MRVEAIFREQWGYVETNASYQDPQTDKSRELDVYAMWAEKIGPLDTDFIFAVLLIECINNPQPLALLTKDPLVPFLHHQQVKLSGLPVKIVDKDDDSEWERLCDFLEMEKYHHYCRGRIATQFCSFQQKKRARSTNGLPHTKVAILIHSVNYVMPQTTLSIDILRTGHLKTMSP